MLLEYTSKTVEKTKHSNLTTNFENNPINIKVIKSSSNISG